jgi:hypothetical protein
VQAKRDTLPAVLDILRQVLREPLLPVRPFEIMQRARLANLEQMRTNPYAGRSPAPTASRRMSQDDVRYVPTIEESIASTGRDARSGAQLYRVSWLAQQGSWRSSATSTPTPVCRSCRLCRLDCCQAITPIFPLQRLLS